MDKIIVKVFPDFLAEPGLWINKVNTKEPLDYLLEEYGIALRYWHHAWEFWIDARHASSKYIQQWKEDGQFLVDRMNERQDHYHFVLDVEDIK